MCHSCAGTCSVERTRWSKECRLELAQIGGTTNCRSSCAKTEVRVSTSSIPVWMVILFFDSPAMSTRTRFCDLHDLSMVKHRLYGAQAAPTLPSEIPRVLVRSVRVHINLNGTWCQSSTLL